MPTVTTAYATPVVTVRPRYEPFRAVSSRPPTTRMSTPALTGTKSWRRTRCATAASAGGCASPAPSGPPGSAAGFGGAGGPMVPRLAAAGSVIADPSLRLRGLRAESEDLGPEDDDAEEDGVEQDVVVAGADVAAEHRLGHADRQPGHHGAAGFAERGEPGRDHADEADRGAAHVGEPGQRGFHDAEQACQHRRADENPPPEQRAVGADDP